MTIADKETNSIVFYDKETKVVCSVVSDDEIVVPSNCEFAIFENSAKPMFRENEMGKVILSGAYVKGGTQDVE